MNVFSSSRDAMALSRLARRIVWKVRRFGLGLLPHAQPCPSRACPVRPRRLDVGVVRAQRRLYAGYFNARARQTGCLFQGRFESLAMEEDHLIAAVRYVALDPVRARDGLQGPPNDRTPPPDN